MLSAAETLDNGGFRGTPELDSHGGVILEVTNRLRTASGSNLIAVMVAFAIES